MIYRREIDGLRAVAVLPVIAYHAGFPLASGGYVGVDVFFVISGYLITGIIINELAEGNFSILRFYERRARRILPALFVVLAVSIALSYFLMTPGPFQNFAQSVFSVSLFVSNIFFVSEQTDYFRQQAELIPLLHTWSLAVEEQFYIVFPVLLAALWKFGWKPILYLLGFLAAGSFALAEWGSRNWIIPNFYLSTSRAWELLAGAFCAFLLSSRSVPTNNVLSVIGLGSIVVPIVAYDASTPFPGVYAIPPVFGTVLIILFTKQESLVGRFLSVNWIVLIGLISYSAYLWHQPIFVFSRLYFSEELHGFDMLPLIAVSLIAAYLSWRYVERPFRRHSNAPAILLTTQSKVFVVSLGGLIVFGLFGLLGHIRDGFPNRFSPPEFVRSGQFELPQVSNGYCFYSLFDDETLSVGEGGLDCWLGAPRSRDQKVLVFGDSYAGHWEPFWDQVGTVAGYAVHSVTSNWCGPSYEDNAFPKPGIGNQYHRQCLINRDYVAKIIDDYQIVVFGGEWDQIEAYGYLDDVEDLVLKTLRETEAEVIIMATPLKFTPQSVERAIFFSDGSKLSVSAEREEILAPIHNNFQSFASNHPRVTFWSREKIFGDNLRLSEEGFPYSLDGGHVSIYGSLKIAEEFLARREPILAKQD